MIKLFCRDYWNITSISLSMSANINTTTLNTIIKTEQVRIDQQNGRTDTKKDYL